MSYSGFTYASPNAGKFVVYKAPDGYRWRLKAGNGEIVAHGEAYSTREGAKRGCEAVKRIAPTAPIEDEY